MHHLSLCVTTHRKHSTQCMKRALAVEARCGSVSRRRDPPGVDSAMHRSRVSLVTLGLYA